MFTEQYTINVDMRKNWKDEPNVQTFIVTLEIDDADIAQRLGARAARNKNKCAKFLNGRVRARVQRGEA